MSDQPKNLSASEAAALAQQYGLKPVDNAVGLATYLKQTWRMRHFAIQYAMGRIMSLSARNRLGLIWEFLTPMMNALMYYLAFGLILGTRKDSNNFVFFLIAGVMTWQLFVQAFNLSSQAMVASKDLTKSTRFPKVLMPISAGLQALLRTLPTIILIYPIAWLTGEPVRWQWLLLPFQMVLVVLFGMGLGLIASRLINRVRDMIQVLPLFTRLLMFISGIFYSVEVRFESAPHWIRAIAEGQPVAVALNTTRGLFIPEDLPTFHQILGLVAVTAFFLILGFVLYWRGEKPRG